MRDEAERKLLLTEDEAGEVLGLKPRFLRDLRRTGEITYVRVATRVFYRHEDLDEFVERHVVKGRS